MVGKHLEVLVWKDSQSKLWSWEFLDNISYSLSCMFIHNFSKCHLCTKLSFVGPILLSLLRLLYRYVANLEEREQSHHFHEWKKRYLVLAFFRKSEFHSQMKAQNCLDPTNFRLFVILFISNVDDKFTKI